jgi:hypothetical protein
MKSDSFLPLFEINSVNRLVRYLSLPKETHMPDLSRHKFCGSGCLGGGKVGNKLYIQTLNLHFHDPEHASKHQKEAYSQTSIYNFTQLIRQL